MVCFMKRSAWIRWWWHDLGAKLKRRFHPSQYHHQHLLYILVYKDHNWAITLLLIERCSFSLSRLSISLFLGPHRHEIIQEVLLPKRVCARVPLRLCTATTTYYTSDPEDMIHREAICSRIPLDTSIYPFDTVAFCLHRETKWCQRTKLRAGWPRPIDVDR